MYTMSKKKTNPKSELEELFENALDQLKKTWKVLTVPLRLY
ncbi:hypothetical protein [Robertkochia sediminum]|nr:hypothetical protein [Robertkochia sediminum]